MQALKFMHLWHCTKRPSICFSMFKYASTAHTYNTRYTAKRNLSKPKVKTNECKQTAFMAIDFWRDIPTNRKLLRPACFTKQTKEQLPTSIVSLRPSTQSFNKHQVPLLIISMCINLKYR